MRRRGGIWALVILNAVLLASFRGPAQATITTPVKWSPNVTENYSIDNNVPSGGWRDSIKGGINNFSNLANGNGPEFVFNGIVTASYDQSNACSGGSQVFAPASLSVTWLGYTTWCTQVFGTQDRIVGFDIALNRDPDINWYSGSGNPGANQWDVRSIAAHEAGHATGLLGHFNDGDAWCPVPRTAATATMCSGNPGIVGTTWLRSLEGRDFQAISDAY